MKTTNNFTNSPCVALLAFLLMIVPGCKKFLDKKPDDKLVIVTSTRDMQALLDNNAKMNFNDQAMSEICADNYYMTDAVFNARKEAERNQYTWAPANVFEPQYNIWADSYGAIYIANLVLERAGALENNIEDKASLYAVRAQAQFHRARQFLHILTVWSLDYNPATASTDLGIPLITEPDFNIVSTRASVAESYAKVLSDLKQAIPFLPVQTISPLRASKAAGFGMMARALLYREDYKNAGLYADSCLALQSTLIDFNKLNPALAFPVTRPNVEIIFESKMQSAGQIVQSRCYVNPELYALYPDNDLRKTIFFQRGTLDYIFKGNYEGDGTLFNGIAVDEALLIRAECAVKLGNIQAGLSDLNLLRKNRIRSASYIAVSAATLSEALNLVKLERRLEFPFRGLRWMDIKRWNDEGDQILLTRKQNQGSFNLPPKDLRYAVAIPEDVIQQSGMKQNPR